MSFESYLSMVVSRLSLVLAHMTNDQRLSTVVEKLSLRFSVIDEFSSNPTGAAEKNDLRVTSGLVASF